jgi:predicted XRE-type DNA-binding protein
MSADLFSYAPVYPSQPGFKLRDTSRAAARDMKSRMPSIRNLVLNAIKQRPQASFEIANTIGVSYRSTQPRTSELARMGLIVDSGQRRFDPETGKQVIVWAAA